MRGFSVKIMLEREKGKKGEEEGEKVYCLNYFGNIKLALKKYQ